MIRRSPFRLLCGAGLFAIFSSTLSKSPVLPLFAHHLGATAADVGFIAAASTVVGILISLPAGALSDLWGRRRVILMAMTVFASAPFLYLLVSGVWGLVAVRIYHGLATAVFGPVALALVADLSSRERGEKMAWYSSATLIGRSSAPFVGGALLGAFALGTAAGPSGYQLVYLACGAGGLLALGLSLLLPLQSRPEIRNAATAHADAAVARRAQRRQVVQGLREVLSHRGILCTSGAEAAQYFAFGTMETFLPLYALRLGLTPYHIGILLGVKIVLIALTKPLMGRLSDRHGRRLPIVAGLLLGAAALILVPVAQSFWTLLPISLAFGLSMATVTASTAALVSDLAKSSAHGAALGTMSTIMDLGHASGPVAAGMLIGAWGYAVGFPAVGVGLGLVGLLFPLLVRTPSAAALSPPPQ